MSRLGSLESRRFKIKRANDAPLFPLTANAAATQENRGNYEKEEDTRTSCAKDVHGIIYTEKKLERDHGNKHHTQHMRDTHTADMRPPILRKKVNCQLLPPAVSLKS